MSENINTENIDDTETEYASVEDLLNMYKTASKVKTLVSTIIIPNIINEKNIIITPELGKKSISVLNDGFCAKQKVN